MIVCPHCHKSRTSGNSCRVDRGGCGRIDREAIESIQISPSATPSRRNSIPPRTPNNSFEKGVRRDERGVPLLDKDASPLHLGEGFNKRSYERSVSPHSSGGNG